MMKEKIKASVIGSTGYAGAELVRLLLKHPQINLLHLTSESYVGKKYSEVYPHMLHLCDQVLISGNDEKNLDCILRESDVVFVALPAGLAMKIGLQIEEKNLKTKLIDLGADYRFDDVAVYEKWYKTKHMHKNANRVYGLAELNREKIKTAQIIGNAGCYTTASILALAPLVKNHLVCPNSLVIDAKSGVSGSGRKANVNNLMAELYDNFKAYGVANHRHTPEIEQALTELNDGKEIILNFTPHLIPDSRGILSTCYAKLKEGVTKDDVSKAFEDAYKDEYFIRLRGAGAYPETKFVRGSNFCDLAWHVDPRTNRVIVLSAIDNLIKGAAGQAIQNMNIAFAIDEKVGLELTPMYP